MKKILSVLLILVVLAGAGYYVFLRQGPSLDNLPTEKVGLKLKWVHQAQFAGMYTAVEKGFYRKNGLVVQIDPFTFDKTPIESVVSGTHTFGIAGADELILARAKGAPVQTIAVIYKTNPVAAYTLKSSGITKPQDFVGKTVGLEKGINVGYLYAATMNKLGIDRKKINEVGIGFDATELLAGTTDVSTGYIINEPQLVVEAGLEVQTILMADYGVNMYADVIIASEETIKSRPELVLNFLKASLDGWQYAIENQAEAVDATLKYATKSTKAHQTFMLKSSIPLIRTGQIPLGMMEAKQWTNAQKILLEQKILLSPIDVQKAYTLQFLNEIYKSKP